MSAKPITKMPAASRIAAAERIRNPQSRPQGRCSDGEAPRSFVQRGVEVGAERGGGEMTLPKHEPEWTPSAAEYKRMEQEVIKLMMKVHDLERGTGFLWWLSICSILLSLVRMLFA